MNRHHWIIGILGSFLLAALAGVLSSPTPVRAEAWTGPQMVDDYEEVAPGDERDRERGLEDWEDDPPPPAEERPRHRRPRGGDEQDERRHERRRERPPRGERPEFHEGRPHGPPPEMVLLAMEVIREKMPDYYQRLQRLKHRRPEQFEQAIGKIMPVLMEYVNLREHNAELAETIIEEFKIEQRLRMLGRDFQTAEGDPEKQERLKKEIVRLVNEQFELRHMRRVARLDEFEERLRRQQERLEREREKFEMEMSRRGEMVANRVEEVKRGKRHGRMRDRMDGRMRKEMRPRGPRSPGSDDEFDERPHGPRGDRGPSPDRPRHPRRRPMSPPDETDPED